jgi:hypothetical protein
MTGTALRPGRRSNPCSCRPSPASRPFCAALLFLFRHIGQRLGAERRRRADSRKYEQENDEGRACINCHCLPGYRLQVDRNVSPSADRSRRAKPNPPVVAGESRGATRPVAGGGTGRGGAGAAAGSAKSSCITGCVVQITITSRHHDQSSDREQNQELGPRQLKRLPNRDFDRHPLDGQIFSAAQAVRPAGLDLRPTRRANDESCQLPHLTP